MANRVPRAIFARGHASSPLRRYCLQRSANLLNVAARIARTASLFCALAMHVRPTGASHLLDCTSHCIGFTHARRASILVVLSLRSVGDRRRGRCARRRPTEIEQIDVDAGQRRSSRSRLRDRLVVGLQARLKSEVAFCRRGGRRRFKPGNLPQRLVDETFFWARDARRVGRNRPHVSADHLLSAGDERPREAGCT